MPKGPNGERRSADVFGCATTVARIATVEAAGGARPVGRRASSARVGGNARAGKLADVRRKEIAKAAPAARWRD
jgi:hypothetical protein